MPESQPQTQSSPDANQERGNRRRRGGRAEQGDADPKDESGEKKEKGKGKGEGKVDWAERAKKFIPERSLLSDLETSSQKDHEKKAARIDKEKKDEEVRQAHLDEAGLVDQWSPMWKQQLEEANLSVEENGKMIAFLESQLRKADLIRARAEAIRELEAAQSELEALHKRRAAIAGQVHEILQAREAKEAAQEKNKMDLASLVSQRDDAAKALEFTPNDEEAKRAHAELAAFVEAKEKEVAVATEEKESKKKELEAKKNEVAEAEHALKAAREAKEAAPDDAEAAAELEKAEAALKGKREAFGAAQESAEAEQKRVAELEKAWKLADRDVRRQEKDIGAIEDRYGELSAHIKLERIPLWDPNGAPPAEAPSSLSQAASSTKESTQKKGPDTKLWVDRRVAQTGRVTGGILKWMGEGVKDMFSAAKSYLNNPGKLFGGHKHFFGRTKKDEGGGKKK